MNLKNKLNNILRKFNVELHGTGYLQSLAKGEFKKDEFTFFTEVFKKNEPITIFDVGANRGEVLKQFNGFFPTAKIYAFEPLKTVFDELSNKFSSLPNVKLENIGISNIDGQLTFHINKSVDTSSFLASTETGLNSDVMVKTLEQSIVSVKTIDSYARENNIDRINILKLDIQGSELNALKGAKTLLENKKIDVIYTESYFIQQYVDQPLFPEIVAHLKQYDYLLQDIYNPIYGKQKLAWCDAMFIRSDY